MTHRQRYLSTLIYKAVEREGHAVEPVRDRSGNTKTISDCMSTNWLHGKVMAVLYYNVGHDTHVVTIPIKEKITSEK
jgi:hypothetical protein